MSMAIVPILMGKLAIRVGNFPIRMGSSATHVASLAIHVGNFDIRMGSSATRVGNPPTLVATYFPSETTIRTRLVKPRLLPMDSSRPNTS